jgi:uncharacterized membrane protein YqjE
MEDHSQRQVGGIPPRHGDVPSAPPASWADSIVQLVGTRIALIQAEARQAAANNAGRFAMLIAALLLTAFAWILLMAAAVGLLQAFAGFPWYWGCLTLAAVHLLAILALLRRAREPGPPAFQHTLAEFQKDREWLQNLQHPKSGN